MNVSGSSTSLRGRLFSRPLNRCFLQSLLVLLFSSTITEGALSLNSHILVFGRMTIPSMDSVDESVRAHSPTQEDVQPHPSGIHTTESIYRVMQKIKAKVEGRYFSEEQIYIHADVLRQGKWFEYQSLTAEKASYSFTVPSGAHQLDEQHHYSDTKIWIAASLVIPTHAMPHSPLHTYIQTSRQGYFDKNAKFGNIQQACNGGYLAILTKHNYTELRSSFHVSMDIDLSPKFWVHSECISLNGGNEGSLRSMRSMYEERKITTTVIDIRFSTMIYAAAFIVATIYCLMIFFTVDKHDDEDDGDIDAQNEFGQNWKRDESSGRLAKM